MDDMSSRRRRGFGAERELVRKLWRMGFAAIRAPASGAKVKKSVYPDVVAIYRGKVLVFEVKSRKKLCTIYIPHRQLVRLEEFARRAGGEAYIAIKLGDLKTWKVVALSSIICEGDRCRIPKDVIENSKDLSQLLAEVLGCDLTKYMKR